MSKNLKNRLLKLLSISVCSLMLLTGCGQSAQTSGSSDSSSSSSDKKTKVGFIYVGSAADGGYSTSHDNGRKYMEEKIPNVESVIKESVPEGADVEKVAKDMIDQGCSAIFATSYGYMDYIEKLSKEFPEVKFFHCSGNKTTDNMTAYFGRIYQARYLTGIVAGMKSLEMKEKGEGTNTIGYVAAFPILECVRGINAFTLGVRSVNPDAVVKVTWTNTWYDPAKEKDAAVALLDQGVDVIAQHQDTAGPQQAAEEKGKFSIGYNVDMSKAAPKANMTSAVWNWGPYYEKAVQSVIDGTYKSENTWMSMDTGLVDIAPLNENAPEGAQAKVDEVKAKIIDGSFDVFEGPIKDQSGNIKIQEGQKMTDKEMLSFDWFVEGVEGQIN